VWSVFVETLCWRFRFLRRIDASGVVSPRVGPPEIRRVSSRDFIAAVLKIGNVYWHSLVHFPGTRDLCRHFISSLFIFTALGRKLFSFSSIYLSYN
ncbi:MAG: hypothetical protein AABZ57_07130, partial [Candidatus Margulisiibacteriota bacterium]